MELVKQAPSADDGRDQMDEGHPEHAGPAPKAETTSRDDSASDAPASGQDTTDRPAPKKGQRKRLFLIFGGLLALAGASWWGWATFIAADAVSTENAYTNVEVAQVTPLVSAPVKRVLVVNSQHVEAGDVLVELDDTDLRLAV